MKKIFLCFILLCSIMNLSARKKDKQQVEVIVDLSNKGPVYFGFKYDNIVRETKKLESGKEEVVIKDYGQSSHHIFAVDSIQDYLNTKNKLELAGSKSEAKYTILFHPVTVRANNHYIILKIEIYDEQKKRISTKNIEFIFSEVLTVERSIKDICDYIVSVLIKAP